MIQTIKQIRSNINFYRRTRFDQTDTYVTELESYVFIYIIIIKCVGFKSINYTTNLNIASSSRVFNKFDFFFVFIKCIASLFESIKLLLFKKNTN